MSNADASLIGKRFGKLTVLDLDHVGKYGPYWLCKCDCGNQKVILGNNLKRGLSKSCGCRVHELRTEDLTGKRFGRLYVTGFDHMNTRGESYWACECDCGNKTIVGRSSLLRGATSSCGCRMREGMHAEDLTGKTFGHLYVVRPDHKSNKIGQYWLCSCDCGNEILLRTRELLSGRTTSCGCCSRNKITITSSDYDSLYNIWVNMKQRCKNSRNPAYERYGGRGIQICDEWNSFENFRDWALNNGYEHGLTIDRRNNNGGYYPNNCRWVDDVTQANNRRSNHYITYNEETHTISEWSKIMNVQYTSLMRHIKENDMSDFERYFNVCDL